MGNSSELEGDICVDGVEKRKSEASDLDSALAKRRPRHKSLAIRRNSNSSELEGDICVDANFSGPKDDALEKRKSRYKRLHSNSSKLGEDIKLQGGEQEAQEELNKPESPRDEPPWQGAVTEEQVAAVNVQGETIKSATPGDSV